MRAGDEDFYNGVDELSRKRRSTSQDVRDQLTLLEEAIFDVDSIPPDFDVDGLVREVRTRRNRVVLYLFIFFRLFASICRKFMDQDKFPMKPKSKRLPS
jgi:hypothetical protein